MRFLLNDTEFTDARAALAAGQVSAELVAFLHRLVATLGRSGSLAPVLSPTGRWVPEDYEEITHEWIADGGLLERGLQQAFDVAASPRAIARYLERAFRNWLTSRLRKNAEPRLLVRSREILQGGEFAKVVEAKHWLDEWWALPAFAGVEPYQHSDEHLVGVAFALGELAIIRHDADHADPVISNPDLERLLTAVFEGAGAPLTLRHIAVVLRRRFAFAYDEAPVEIDAVSEPSSAQATPAEEILSTETAKEIFAELSGRQILILHDRFNEGLKLEEIAKKRLVSRGTADNELRRASSVIRDKTLDDENHNSAVEKLLEMAFKDSEGAR
jgi:hypothetical protein